MEVHGLDGLTLQGVADAVGVRTPSLYKRIRGRDHLVAVVVEDVAEELRRTLEAIESTGVAGDDLRELAQAARAFARASPRGYGLLFTALSGDAQPDVAVLARASGPVLDLAGRIAGEAHALDGARTIVAWLHGFISMELAGAFRLGGDVDDAFAFGIERLVTGLSATRQAP